MAQHIPSRSSLIPALMAAFVLMAQPLSAHATITNINKDSTLTDSEAPSAVDAPQPPKFAPAIDDLPLMPGLSPVTDQDTLFVVPRAGRIADSTVEGTVDVDDVYSFYRSTLPQLGWQSVDVRTYSRNGEFLRIDAHADGKRTTVRFSVRPG